MKRSVVLNLIEGLFRLAMDEQCDAEGHAENLLANLEELGMLPPSTGMRVEEFYTENGVAVLVEIPDENMWEPECPELIKADLGEYAGRDYKDDLFGGRIEDEND